MTVSYTADKPVVSTSKTTYVSSASKRCASLYAIGTPSLTKFASTPYITLTPAFSPQNMPPGTTEPQHGL